MGSKAWSRGMGQERTVLYRRLLDATFEEKVAAYEDLKRKYLKQVRIEADRLEIRRRIAESLVTAAVGQPWIVFVRYLNRLGRLGFATPDILISTCYDVARAAQGDKKAKKTARRLMARAERALNDPKLSTEYRIQEERLLLRAKEELGE